MLSPPGLTSAVAAGSLTTEHSPLACPSLTPAYDPISRKAQWRRDVDKRAYPFSRRQLTSSRDTTMLFERLKPHHRIAKSAFADYHSADAGRLCLGEERLESPSARRPSAVVGRPFARRLQPVTFVYRLSSPERLNRTPLRKAHKNRDALERVRDMARFDHPRSNHPTAHPRVRSPILSIRVLREPHERASCGSRSLRGCILLYSAFCILCSVLCPVHRSLPTPYLATLNYLEPRGTQLNDDSPCESEPHGTRNLETSSHRGENRIASTPTLVDWKGS